MLMNNEKGFLKYFLRATLKQWKNTRMTGRSREVYVTSIPRICYKINKWTNICTELVFTKELLKYNFSNQVRFKYAFINVFVFVCLCCVCVCVCVCVCLCVSLLWVRVCVCVFYKLLTVSTKQQQVFAIKNKNGYFKFSKTDLIKLAIDILRLRTKIFSKIS